MLQTILGYYGIVFGLLSAVGGVMGYLKAKSLVSLIVGDLVGLLIIMSSILILRHYSIGMFALLILSAMVFGFFGVRFWSSRAMMPAGLMTFLSLGALILIYLTSKQTPAA